MAIPNQKKIIDYVKSQFGSYSQFFNITADEVLTDEESIFSMLVKFQAKDAKGENFKIEKAPDCCIEFMLDKEVDEIYLIYGEGEDCQVNQGNIFFQLYFALANQDIDWPTIETAPINRPILVKDGDAIYKAKLVDSESHQWEVFVGQPVTYAIEPTNWSELPPGAK